MPNGITLLKTLLPTTLGALFSNSSNSFVKSTASVLCNYSGSAQHIWLAYCNGSDVIGGYVFYNFEIQANETIFLGDKILFSGDTIKGYCDAPDTVAFSSDIIPYP